MKKLISALLCLAVLFSFTIPAFATGNPNIDGGGGGMGSGTGSNSWSPGRDGVRITIIRDNDNAPVSVPIDFSNGTNGDIAVHFGKVSKIQYRGSGLTPQTNKYACVKPTTAMPRIVSSNGGNNISAIRSYFTDKGTIQFIATQTGFDYDKLVGGEYKLLLEPIAYLKFNSVMYAMTATEAALLDQVKGGGLRSKMVSLSHKNLPLAMFLETADLGFPAWGGSTTKAASNEQIISSLGMGIIRFSEPDPEPPKESNVTYRCDTEVITAVTLTTGAEKTPKDPAYARFSINGRTYSHTDIYIPEDGSQLAWVKWRTPKEPGYITITVTSNCNVSSNEIVAEIVDLDKNPPPDPQANDRNDGFAIPSKPNKPNVTSLTWGEWDCWWHEYWVWIPVWDYCDHGEDGGHYVDNGYWEDQGWWDYAWIPYSASLTATMQTKPDAKAPTASAKQMKSGYGLNANVSAQMRSNAPSSDITGMQNVVSYFPEFEYATYWRLLKRLNTGLSSTHEFQKNKYSTYNRPSHFSPVWFPDGRYTTYAECLDAWTPAGMLQISLTDDITIRDSLFDDWHIRPVK